MFTFEIQAETLKELVSKMEDQLAVYKENEELQEQVKQIDKKMFEITHTEINSAIRKHKRWTQFEIEVLYGHYRHKTMKWLAQSLQRTPASINQKLDEMYRDKKWPKKRNKLAGTVFEEDTIPQKEKQNV